MTTTRKATAKFSGRRVANAVASSTVGQIISVAQTYLLVPLFLSAWGDEGYGRWVSLTALASYLVLLDFGGQSFVGNRLAQEFAQGRYDDFRATLRQGLSLFSAVALLMLLSVAGVLLIPGLPWNSEGRLVLFWQACGVVLSIVGGVLVTSYTATGRVVRSTVVGVLSRMATLVLSAVLLVMGFRISQYAFGLFMLSVVATVLIVADLRRELGDLFRPRITYRSLRSGFALLGGSLDYWFVSLSGALKIQGVILVISALLGNAVVAQFATHRAAASLTLYCGSLLRPALWTELTFMSALSDTARLRSVVRVSLRVSAWSAAVAGAGIGVVAPLGYAAWTRSKLELDILLLVMLLGQAVLGAWWSAASWPLLSANRARMLARFSVVNGALTVAGAYIALRLGGDVRAVVAVSLCADILCAAVPIPFLAATFLGISAWALVRDLVRAVVCAIPFAAVAYVSFELCETRATRLATSLAVSLLLVWPALLVLLGRQDLARIRRSILKR